MPAFPKLHFPKFHADSTTEPTDPPVESEDEDGNDDA